MRISDWSSDVCSSDLAPIEVNGVVLPTIVAVVLRYAIALLLPWLVSKGYIDEGSTEGVAAYVLVAATALYGIWKTVKVKKDLIVTAEVAPNDVAIVKK